MSKIYKVSKMGHIIRDGIILSRETCVDELNKISQLKERYVLAKEREAEVLKMVDLFINKEKSRITDSVSGCTRMEAEYAIKILRKMKQEIEALLNGGGR